MCLVAGVRNEVHAQRADAAPSLMVGVAGTADVGGAFEGTFLLTRFATMADDGRLVAVGSIGGVLNDRGIVTKLAIPVTVAPSAALSRVFSSAPVTCGVRVGLERSAFPVLGSVVTLARTSFDITAPDASAVATAASSTLAQSTMTGGLATPAASDLGIASWFGRGTTTSSGVVGTPVPTASVSSATPGVISPAPAAVNQPVTVSQQQLGQLLCSASGLSQSSGSPAQLAAALNQVMVALHQ